MLRLRFAPLSISDHLYCRALSVFLNASSSLGALFLLAREKAYLLLSRE